MTNPYGGLVINPLPDGASTEAKQDVSIANQTDGDQKTQIVDGSGNVISDSNPLMIAKGFKIPKYDSFTITRVASQGKIYTKSDNKLYFQSGDGVEHEIAFV